MRTPRYGHLMARRMLTISVAALTLALTGCAPSGGLVIDSAGIDGGGGSVCFFDDLAGEAAIFGVGITNTSDTELTITDVTLDRQNTVLVSEIAITDGDPNELGWGTGRTDAIEPSQRQGWESRSPAVGASIAAGDRAWLLIVARSGGPPEQRTGFRGVRVEFDGAPWMRSTENENVYGFGPATEDCDAGMEDETT